MTATDNSLHPWISGEFDITRMLRGAPRILNKPQFLDHVGRQLEIIRKSIDSRYAVLMVKLDDYNAVLARGGAKAADEMVRVAAENIGMELAPRDAVAILRAGHVGVLLEITQLRGSSLTAAQRIGQVLSRMPVGTGSPGMTASIGISKITGGYLAAGDVLRDAGLAMQCAEAEGPGSTVVFNRSMDQTLADVAIAT
ncbi:MAG: diguanylate cyclase [Gemmatimonadaceae bacterium]